MNGDEKLADTNAKNAICNDNRRWVKSELYKLGDWLSIQDMGVYIRYVREWPNDEDLVDRHDFINFLDQDFRLKMRQYATGWADNNFVDELRRVSRLRKEQTLAMSKKRVELEMKAEPISPPSRKPAPVAKKEPVENITAPF